MIGIPAPSSLDLTISVTSFLEKPFRWQAPQILSPVVPSSGSTPTFPSCTFPSFQELLCIPSYTSPTPTYSFSLSPGAYWVPPSPVSYLNP